MSAATQNEMERLKEDRDAAIEQVIYWRERAVGAEDERDALAALCQEGAAVLERTANDTLDGRNVAVRLREANTTSLARLKAQWQAEVLEWVKANPYVALNTRITKLRRQAEENSDE